MPPELAIRWRLTIDSPRAEVLAEALAPETDPEHAQLDVQDGRLVATGAGDVGAALHALDDVLACLTGAVEALEADP